MRGDALHVNRNKLLFAVISSSEIADAKDAVRRALVWASIDAESEGLELTRAAKADTSRKLTTTRDRAKKLVLGVYKHLLAPSQDAGDLRRIE